MAASPITCLQVNAFSFVSLKFRTFLEVLELSLGGACFNSGVYHLAGTHAPISLPYFILVEKPFSFVAYLAHPRVPSLPAWAASDCTPCVLCLFDVCEVGFVSFIFNSVRDLFSNSLTLEGLQFFFRSGLLVEVPNVYSVSRTFFVKPRGCLPIL